MEGDSCFFVRIGINFDLFPPAFNNVIGKNHIPFLNGTFLSTFVPERNVGRKNGARGRNILLSSPFFDFFWIFDVFVPASVDAVRRRSETIKIYVTKC